MNEKQDVFTFKLLDMPATPLTFPLCRQRETTFFIRCGTRSPYERSLFTTTSGNMEMRTLNPLLSIHLFLFLLVSCLHALLPHQEPTTPISKCLRATKLLVVEVFWNLIFNIHFRSSLLFHILSSHHRVFLSLFSVSTQTARPHNAIKRSGVMLPLQCYLSTF